jgi:hypothetical protein
MHTIIACILGDFRLLLIFKNLNKILPKISKFQNKIRVLKSMLLRYNFFIFPFIFFKFNRGAIIMW